MSNTTSPTGPSGSASPTQVAAMYETQAQAEQARLALLSAGLGSDRIAVLEPKLAERPAESPEGLWGSLKRRFVPDQHAHHLAEGVSRGHPVVMADVSGADTQAAVSALKSAQPVDMAQRADRWQAEGWSGIHEGQRYWLDANPDSGAAASEGITASGAFIGDYGAVGQLHGGTRADTDITRGLPARGAGTEAVLVNDDPAVRVFQIR